MRSGMSSHQSARSGKDEWLTPPEILQALGPFDLDPCAATNGPWPTATTEYSKADGGLNQVWTGRVWCNPPYGREANAWLKRLADHGDGTALVFARTETAMFFDHVWDEAHALLFLRGRLHFHHIDGSRAVSTAGAPSVLIAYGLTDAVRLKESGLDGAFIDLRRCLK